MSEDHTLKFTITENEYAAAQLLFEKKAHNFTLNLFVALALVVVGFFRLSITPAWEDYLFIAAGIIFLIVIIGRATLFARLTFRQTPKFNDEHSIEFSDDGISFKTNGLEAKFNWSFYNMVIENTNFFLLVYGKSTFTIIPKRAFNNEQQQNLFKELIAKKIGQVI